MRHIKEEFDQLSFKDFLIFMLSIFCLVAGTVAIFLSLYIPPLGEVHNSVLTYFGMCSVFSGTLLGIKIRYDRELTIFQSKITELLKGLPTGNERDAAAEEIKKRIKLEKNE